MALHFSGAYYMLYSREDPVFILTGSDFTVGKDGRVKLNASAYRGQGLIKAYAPWCGHCQSKVHDIKIIGEHLNGKKGAKVYVFDASTPEVGHHFKYATTHEGKILIEGFPTMLYVDHDLNVDKLVNELGKPIYTVPEALGAMCSKHLSEACDVRKKLSHGKMWKDVVDKIVEEEVLKLTPSQVEQANRMMW
jgi:thiol-disulfide isomerase/thioredoxin